MKHKSFDPNIPVFSLLFPTTHKITAKCIKKQQQNSTQNPKKLSLTFKLYLCRVFTRELVEMVPPPLKRVIHPPEHPSQQEPHQLCHQDLYFPKEKFYKLLNL